MLRRSFFQMVGLIPASAGAVAVVHPTSVPPDYREIVRLAMIHAGVIAPDEQPTHSEMKFGLETLSDMLRDWKVKGKTGTRLEVVLGLAVILMPIYGRGGPNSAPFSIRLMGCATCRVCHLALLGHGRWGEADYFLECNNQDCALFRLALSAPEVAVCEANRSMVARLRAREQEQQRLDQLRLWRHELEEKARLEALHGATTLWHS